MTQVVCSWDVGIKNLAFCTIKYHDEDIEILDWDIINLIEDEINKCSETIKTKKTTKQCKCNAKYFYFNGEKKIYLCGKHKGSYIFDSSKVEKQFIDIDTTEKCQHKKKDKFCSSKGKCTVNNQVLCNVHKKQYLNNELKKYKLQKCKKVLAYGNSIEFLSKNIATKVKQRLDITNVDKIVIENQPSMKNPRIKTVACFLYQHLVEHGLVNQNSKVSSVDFMSPSNKLKIGTGKTVEMLSRGKKSSDIYDITKTLAIKYTQAIIAQPTQEKFLVKHTKKDDLADAFLQGIYYLFFKNKLPYKHLETIQKTLVDLAIEEKTKKENRSKKIKCKNLNVDEKEVTNGGKKYKVRNIKKEDLRFKINQENGERIMKVIF